MENVYFKQGIKIILTVKNCALDITNLGFCVNEHGNFLYYVHIFSLVEMRFFSVNYNLHHDNFWKLNVTFHSDQPVVGT